MEARRVVPDKFPIGIFEDPRAAETFMCQKCKFIPHFEHAFWDKNCGAVFCQCCSEIIEKGVCTKCNKHPVLGQVLTTNILGAECGKHLTIACPWALCCTWKGKIEALQHVCKVEQLDCCFKSYGCTFKGDQEELRLHLQNSQKEHGEYFKVHDIDDRVSDKGPHKTHRKLKGVVVVPDVIPKGSPATSTKRLEFK